MKRISFTMLIASIMLMSSYTGKAQVSGSVHINIGSPPVWAPPAYAHTVRYYYIPEIDCYYDAEREGYYYDNGPGWSFSAYLPASYRGYDIGRLHHVVVNYYGSRPYTYFSNRRYGYLQHYRPDRYRQEYRQPREREERHWNEDGDRGNNRGHGEERGGGHGEDRGHGSGEGHGGEGHGGGGEGHGGGKDH